jgi:hypothetical protein
MTKPEFLRLKNLPAKCLLACLLFFSFITIAGYSVKSNELIQQTVLIELLYSTEGRTTDKTALFRKHFALGNETTSHFRKYNLFNLVVYNRLVKVKANLFYKKSDRKPIVNWLTEIKTISQTADENASPSFTS